MPILDPMPKWMKEMISFCGIKSTFVVAGNINDMFPTFAAQQGQAVISDFNVLPNVLNQIYTQEPEIPYNVLYMDPLFGFYNPQGMNSTAAMEMVTLSDSTVKSERERSNHANHTGRQNADGESRYVFYSELVRTMLTTQLTNATPEQPSHSVLVVANLSSRFIASSQSMSQEETTIFSNLYYASLHARRGDGKHFNTLVLLVEKFNDLPAWFYMNNPNVRTITIPNPDRETRNAFIDRFFNNFSAEPDGRRDKEHFVDITDGMKVLELNDLRKLYDSGTVQARRVEDVVAIYKYGFKENKWALVRPKLIDTPESTLVQRLEKYVMGQREAVMFAAQVLRRAATGLSGMQHSSSASKPRGILFLAGPTGTGKTELVKTIARLLFGDERAMLRFDMSEYTAEHSDQKLFGAPPGYVGYDNGGQLTNAVRANPFSILLFDEIEKAHPSIMDKFLQILEDGRMTDGQGNTVYFSETLIFFTSNAGIETITADAAGRVIARTPNVTPKDSYETVRRSVLEGLKKTFKPEVLNRLGNNVVVFNFITPEVSATIVHSQVDHINQNVRKDKRIAVQVDPAAISLLCEQAMQDEVRHYGGRGIGNMVETRYLNPLSDFIFQHNVVEGERIVAVRQGDGIAFQR